MEMPDFFVDGVLRVEVVGDCLRIILTRMVEGEARPTVGLILPAAVVRAAQLAHAASLPN